MSAPDQIALGQDHQHTAAGFLRSVFKEQEKGVVVLLQKPSKRSTFIPLDRDGWHKDAASEAMSWREKENVYLQSALRRYNPTRVVASKPAWSPYRGCGPTSMY